MPALDKAKLRRELERERRQRIDARLRELRALIAEARKARRAAVAGKAASARASSRFTVHSQPSGSVPVRSSSSAHHAGSGSRQ